VERPDGPGGRGHTSGTKPEETRDDPPPRLTGDGTARLFCALRLPGETVERLVRWQLEELGDGGRLVPPENLHVTLAFLGSRPAGEVPAIVRELRAAAAASSRPALRVARYRETRSVGMLVLGEDDGHAARLATDVQERLERLGAYRRERRPWLPHVTVLRFRQAPRLRPALPDLGRVCPSEAAVYHSVLRPTGARYEIVESVVLGG
jgi:RNA 2',3'-cyclic 3'-phosphodiesterase